MAEQICKDCAGRGWIAGPLYALEGSYKCPTCDGAGKVHRPRWKVACVNWSLPDAPKAVAYVLGSDGFACSWSYFSTWAEAIRYADHHARTTKNGDNK